MMKKTTVLVLLDTLVLLTYWTTVIGLLTNWHRYIEILVLDLWRYALWCVASYLMDRPRMVIANNV